MSRSILFTIVKKIIFPSVLMVFGFIAFCLIAMPKIYNGKTLNELIEEHTFRSDLPNKVNKLTNLEISKDIKILYLKSFIAFNGEGTNEILVEFNPQESEKIMKQIQLKQWEKTSMGYKLHACEIQSQGIVQDERTTYYSISKSRESYEMTATFCPENNRLKINERFL